MIGLPFRVHRFGTQNGAPLMQSLASEADLAPGNWTREPGQQKVSARMNRTETWWCAHRDSNPEPAD